MLTRLADVVLSTSLRTKRVDYESLWKDMDESQLMTQVSSVVAEGMQENEIWQQSRFADRPDEARGLSALQKHPCSTTRVQGVWDSGIGPGYMFRVLGLRRIAPKSEEQESSGKTKKEKKRTKKQGQNTTKRSKKIDHLASFTRID